MLDDNESRVSRFLTPVLLTELGQLFHNDCVDLTRAIPEESVDCFFADPPFNLSKNYGPGISDNLTDNVYLDWSKEWLTQAIRILKPGGSLFLYNLPKWNLQLGAWLSNYLQFKNWVAVDIKFSLPIPKRLYPSHYSLLYFSKGSPKSFHPPRLPIETCRHCGGEIKDYGGYKSKMNPHGVSLADVWTDISPVRHKKYKHRVANALSLKMLDRVIDIATEEGDLVVDPFGGSGTTYVAAELKGRRWIGSEIGECAPIMSRFQNISIERAHLDQLAKKKNTLFTGEALDRRRRNGHDSSRYQISPNGNGPKVPELILS